LSNFLEKSRTSAEVVTTDEWDFESVSSANSNTPAGLQAKGKGACLSFLLCAQSDGFSILNFPEKVKMGFQKFCAGCVEVSNIGNTQEA